MAPDPKKSGSPPDFKVSLLESTVSLFNFCKILVSIIVL